MLSKLNIFRRCQAALRAFGWSERAVAGVEFALIGPLLILLFIGSVETSRYLAAARRVQNAANDIGLAVSAIETTMTDADAWRINAMMPIMMPEVGVDARAAGHNQWWMIARVAFSFITIAPADPACEKDCKYEADVSWSVGHAGLGRNCGKVDFGELVDEMPSEFQRQPTNVVSVQVMYSFIPRFGLDFLGSREIYRVFHVPPKYTDKIDMAYGDSALRVC